MKLSDISETISGGIATSMGKGNGFANGGPGMRRRMKIKDSVYDMNKDDPNNPEVLIQGYGRMNMDTLKNALKGDLKVLYGKAKADDWEYIQYMLSNSPFSAKLKALMDAMEELEGIRRKGGPKSRGINKR